MKLQQQMIITNYHKDKNIFVFKSSATSLVSPQSFYLRHLSNLAVEYPGIKHWVSFEYKLSEHINRTLLTLQSIILKCGKSIINRRHSQT